MKHDEKDNVIVTVRDLVKIYSPKNKEWKVVANDGINFDIYRGECVGILGPNGSGKTTLVRQLIGYLDKTSGDIKLFGRDYDKDPKEVRKRIGYMKQDRYAHWDHLKVEEALIYAGNLKLMKNEDIKKNIEELIEILGLSSYRNKMIRNLSGGNRQSVSLAITLLNKPELIILDEPSAGLDPVKRADFWDLLGKINKQNGSAIMIVSHNVAEIERIAERVIILSHGKIIAQGRVEDLKNELAGEIRVEMLMKRNKNLDGLYNQLRDFNPIKNENKLLFYSNKGKIADVLKEIVEHEDWNNVDGFDIINPSLEDIYIKIVNEKIG